MTDGKSPTEWAGEAMPVERGHASRRAGVEGRKGKPFRGPAVRAAEGAAGGPHTVAPEPGAQPAARSRRCLPAVGERPGTQR